MMPEIDWTACKEKRDELERMLSHDMEGRSYWAAKFARDFERRMFTWLLLMCAKKVYVTQDVHSNDSRITFSWQFHEERPEGRECTSYDMTNLLNMPDGDFERMPDSTNKGLVKSWREIMKGEYR